MPFRRFVTGGGSSAAGEGDAGGLGTGVFTRNCVLSGKRWDEFGVPAYVKLRNVITTFPSHDNLLGAMSSASGTASGALPRPRPTASMSEYCELASANDWIQYTHPYRTVTADGYTFMTHSDYAPNGWEFQGSNDGSNWTTLDTVDYSGETWATGVNVYHGTINEGSHGSYTYHRIVFTSFVGSTVRIYHFQFYDSDVTSTGHIYIDADGTDPLKIAFADGYEGGLPKDAISAISLGTELDLNSEVASLALSNEALLNTNAAAAHLFAVYNSETKSVSYELEPVYENQIHPIDLLASGLSLYNISSPLAAGSWQDMFDQDLASYADGSGSVDTSIEFTLPQPLMTDVVYLKFYFSHSTDTPKLAVDLSEDGLSYERICAYSGYSVSGWSGLGSGTKTKIIYLDRVYAVAKFKVYLGGSGGKYTRVYESMFNDAMKNWKRKFSDGKLMEYNPTSDEWQQKYRVPLGMLSIWRNADDNGWDLSSFWPTHVPQMTFAPWFRNTFE